MSDPNGLGTICAPGRSRPDNSKCPVWVVRTIRIVVLLGEHCPPGLPVDLRAEHEQEIREFMREACGRCSPDIWTETVLAAADCAPEPFGLTEMAGCDRTQIGNPRKRLQNGLGSDGWDEMTAVKRLWLGIPPKGTRVAAIEMTTAGDHDLLGLIMHTEGRSVPIDWERVLRDTPSYDSELIAAICGLLERLRALHDESQPAQMLPPLVTCERALGEHTELRTRISPLVDEYVMDVHPSYGGRGRLLTDPYALRLPEAAVSSFFGEWLLSNPPLPRQMKRWGMPRIEFMAPFVQDDQRRYSIAGPPHTDVDLPTTKSPQRAYELARLLASTSRASFAQALRIDGFRHSSATVFRRQALLMSLLYLWWTSPGSPRSVTGGLA